MDATKLSTLKWTGILAALVAGVSFAQAAEVATTTIHNDLRESVRTRIETQCVEGPSGDLTLAPGKTHGWTWTADSSGACANRGKKVKIWFADGIEGSVEYAANLQYPGDEPEFGKPVYRFSGPGKAELRDAAPGKGTFRFHE